MDFVYKCGHAGHVTEMPAEKQHLADAYVKRAEQRDCSDCTQELQEYGFRPISQGRLIPLQGSEKQIAWAEKIRKEFLDEAHRNFKKSLAAGVNTAEEIERAKEATIIAFNQQNQAKWWIDNRGRRVSIFDEEYRKAQEVLVANENS